MAQNKNLEFCINEEKFSKFEADYIKSLYEIDVELADKYLAKNKPVIRGVYCYQCCDHYDKCIPGKEHYKNAMRLI